MKRSLSWFCQDGSRTDGGEGRMSRRQLLQAAGVAAAGSSLMGRQALAAAGDPPLRLVCWPLMNGAEARFFYPGGFDATVLSTVTEPLRKYASLVTFIKNINIAGSDNHFATRVTYSGGSVQRYDSPDPGVKSVDQLIGDSIAMSGTPTPLHSLHLGVIPADSINYYMGSHSKMFYAPKPVDYEANPVTAYDRLLANSTTMPPKPGADFTADSLAIVNAEMNELEARMPGAVSEINKLNLHRDALKTLQPTTMPPTMPPTMTGPIATVEKLRPTLQGKPADAYKYSLFSDVFDAQIDIMARILVGGMTRVATLQAGSADNDLIVPVGRGYPHHVTSHGDQTIFASLQNWYYTKMARLLLALDVPDPLAPGSTVLDNTVIVIIAECLPYTHSSNGVPAMLVGKLGGKIKPGKVIDVGGATNRTLMSTVLKCFGVAPAHFGTNVISSVLA
ncbi:MAG TPA: DUF1552 domain-containing protein [Polyangiaceae bacterium]